MKKLVGILVALVIVLSGALVYVLLNDDKEETNNNGNDSYQFQDIESMEKAKSIEEAYIRIFGENRLYENNPHFDEEERLYFDKKGIFYDSSFVYLLIEMEPGIDTRMEMIDFLHYLQYSGLTTRETVDRFTSGSMDENFYIDMRVYQPVKPGMNTPEPHQIWRVLSNIINVMDFSDKEKMLGEIHRYGELKGVNPSGMK